MRHYENLVIVKPTLTEEEIKSTIAQVEEILTVNGAEIIARDAMGMKKLAYPIEKNARGYFYVMYYKAAPSAISEIERRFRINEEILRFVTMKYDSKREVKAWNDMVEKTKKPAVAEKKEEAAS
ncbi:30S ribosomal protein S6 [Sulfuricurvum sp. IAE1]|jgi:small subunit ribosomal protein S6|uniref:30S ribosomal protein S6 n=1 Tax=Sulfuricurvum sp. IAE1 TaxID=2546102 RepID=UPI00104A40EA|nr:30S ribosomal protein S6 [Sulfuricurvum sp. IAE1]MDD3771008.1 30S ribosomal protein S6 [Sulfuricurvum sp.]MDX9967056.1 30S ribosomal protein S6 [Sulfuricurvum sp.]TDA64439.1 30S ribosomal protein S6 [Sulfuricurvum sp. IAE1]